MERSEKRGNGRRVIVGRGMVKRSEEKGNGRRSFRREKNEMRGRWEGGEGEGGGGEEGIAGERTRSRSKRGASQINVQLVVLVPCVTQRPLMVR